MTPSLLTTIRRRIVRSTDSAGRATGLERIRAIERQVREIAVTPQGRPIILFIGSAHLAHVNLAATIGLISAWALRLAGHRVLYYVCRRGMSQCVLGSNRDGTLTPPPCDRCVDLRDALYPAEFTHALGPMRAGDDTLRQTLHRLPWEDLTAYEHDGLAVARLCLPSLRWVERAFRLESTPFRRTMLQEYIVSALGIEAHFRSIVEDVRPSAVVVFNGTFYPEAVVREVARRHAVPTITYETGFRTPSAFFSHGVATEYAVRVPPGFTFGAREAEQFDAYMGQRLRGEVTMAGRRTWATMRGLSPALRDRVAAYRQVVGIFTNVTWDTSQAYAHAYFTDMFDWLDHTLREAERRPDILFIVRAHPDEARPARSSHEPVGQWLDAGRFAAQPNVLVIPPTDPMSSYDLIRLAKVCSVYNSTVGLEAAMLGAYVIPGGRTRYEQAECTYPTTSREDYLQALAQALDAPAVAPPPQWRERARRFMYFAVFRASLDLSRFVRPLTAPEFTFTRFGVHALRPDQSPETNIIVRGILTGAPFHYA